MLGQARSDSPGAFYHVIVMGIEQDKLWMMMRTEETFNGGTPLKF